ncbi:MAG: WD40/YVTN/BNR-like repeat-containing protein, partial [Algiphilus sp.]
EPLLDIAATPDGERLVAIGGFGQYLVSDDGGDSWQSRQVEAFSGSHLNDLLVAETGTMLIAAERGLMLRSRDRGETWSALDFDYPGSMFGGMHLGGTDWLVFGMRGHAFLSRDDGDTWQALDTGIEDSVFDGVQLDDGRVVLVGSMQTVVIAEPGEWRFTRVIPTKQGTFSTVLPLSDDRILVGGEPGAHVVNLADGSITPAGGN